MTRSTCGSLWYESVENAPEDFWEVVSRGETSSARDEEEKNKDQNKGQRKNAKKRRRQRRSFCVLPSSLEREKKTEEERKEKERFIPAFFSLSIIEKMENQKKFSPCKF